MQMDFGVFCLSIITANNITVTYMCTIMELYNIKFAVATLSVKLTGTFLSLSAKSQYTCMLF